MKLKLFTIAGFLFLVLSGTLTGCMNNIDIRGEMENNRYLAPNKVFSCPVPQLITPGVRIKDNMAEKGDACDVYFQDDFGTWINIVCIEIPEEKIDSMLKRRELFNKFISGGPNTTVLHRETLSDKDGDITYVIIKVPHGSNMVELERGQLDLIEGVFIFHRKNHIYRLSAQDTHEIVGFEPVDENERKGRLKKELLDFYSGMIFNDIPLTDSQPKKK